MSNSQDVLSANDVFVNLGKIGLIALKVEIIWTIYLTAGLHIEQHEMIRLHIKFPQLNLNVRTCLIFRTFLEHSFVRYCDVYSI